MVERLSWKKLVWELILFYLLWIILGMIFGHLLWFLPAATWIQLIWHFHNQLKMSDWL